MTGETPLHRKRRDARGQRHFIDGAMAGLAADPFGDVNAMVEINEVRQLVQALPSQGALAREASMSGRNAV